MFVSVVITTFIVLHIIELFVLSLWFIAEQEKDSIAVVGRIFHWYVDSNFCRHSEKVDCGRGTQFGLRMFQCSSFDDVNRYPWRQEVRELLPAVIECSKMEVPIAPTSVTCGPGGGYGQQNHGRHGLATVVAKG